MTEKYIDQMEYSSDLLAQAAYFSDGFGAEELTNGGFEAWTGTTPDNWKLSGAGAAYAKEETIKYMGAASVKLTRNGTNAFLYQNFHAARGIAYWKGKVALIGAWVYATVPNAAGLIIQFAPGVGDSEYHPGDSTWRWLWVAMVVPADATIVRYVCCVANVDTSAYFDTASAREAYFMPFSSAEKTQGFYSLQLVAAETNSLNKILTRTLHTPVDLTSRSFARLDIRAGRTGSNLAARVYQTYVLNGNLEEWSAGAYAAPDNWTLSGAGAQVERGGEAGDYHATITRNGADAALYQSIHEAKEIDWWKGKEVTLRAEVLATVASRARLAIADGAGTTYSSFHTGSGNWEWLEVTRTIDSAATFVRLWLQVVTGDTSAQFRRVSLRVEDLAVEFTPNILVADTWQTEQAVISGYENSDKNAIGVVQVEIVNADAADDKIYIDNLYGIKNLNDIILTWSPRVRGAGAGVGLPGLAPEAAAHEGLYKIEVYISAVKKRTVYGIDDVTWVYTETMHKADNGSLASEVTFRVYNYIGDYESDYAEVTVKKN